MRRYLSFAVLVAFVWLQSYQLCDASEDAAEDFQASTRIAMQRHALLAATPLPDNDPDVNVPSVYDRTLTPRPVAVNIPWTALAMPSAIPVVARTPHLLYSAPQNLSPPGPHPPFVSSLHSLAPPAL